MSKPSEYCKMMLRGDQGSISAQPNTKNCGVWQECTLSKTVDKESLKNDSIYSKIPSTDNEIQVDLFECKHSILKIAFAIVSLLALGCLILLLAKRS